MKSPEFYNGALRVNFQKFHLKKKVRFLLPFTLAVASLILGSSIYLFSRNTSNIVYHISDRMEVSSQVEAIRDLVPALPSWFLYSLPDGLWMFSFSTITLAIWGFQRSREAIVWFSAALAIGVLMEFLQALATLPGQFDWRDLVCIFFGAFAPLCFTYKSESI